MSPNKTPDRDHQAEVPEQRRTDGEVAGMAPVRIALLLLVLFLGLLVVWVLWPLITGQ